MTQFSNVVREGVVPDEPVEAYRALLSRSATDSEFRAQLLTNPRAALARFAGKNISEIPESLNVTFVENTADATIVLPDFVDTQTELSDRELETVAGGTFDTIQVCIELIRIFKPS